MKFPVSWLRDFVDLTDAPEAIGERLSLLGFELASVDPVSPGKKMVSDTIIDAVLDFEIPANRADAMSVIGLAREASTAYSLPLRTTPVARLRPTEAAEVRVTVEAPDLCPRYAAAVAEVTIGPSPAWLAERLQAAGVRPINNIVDVTNYVMLELGQPMHAFDLDKLAGQELRIRRARTDERIRTLDGADRTLDHEMLVIADAEKVQAIAGVMGGGLSEVNPATKTIVLESACFDPKSVRLTGKRVGLKTEASARFERGTDINAPVMGLERAVALLEEIGAGHARGVFIDRFDAPAMPRRIVLRSAQIQRILGHPIGDADVERILTGLGFKVGPAAPGGVSAADGYGPWQVSVPTFRVDVAREADLIEEVGRHYGYDRLPTTFPALLSPTPPSDPRIERDRLVRRMLLAAGCSEALTFTFIDSAMAAHFADRGALVPIGNPLSAQFAVLRPSLLPGVLAAAAHNSNRQRADVCLFEVGAAVTRSGESRRAAVVWTGDASGSHWSAKGRSVDFFDLKGLVERVAEALHVELSFDPDAVPPHLVRGRAATIGAGARAAGVLGMLTPSIVHAAGVTANEDVYVAELDLDVLSAARTGGPMSAAPLPRYPSISRDISIVVDDTLPAATVRGTIRSVAPDTLMSVREFDRYQGKGVPDGRVSLSLRLTFRSPERTLTDAEAQQAMDAIIAALIHQHQAIQR